MDRKKFISVCSSACLGIVGLHSLMSIQRQSKPIDPKTAGKNSSEEELEVLLTDFQKERNGKLKWKKHLIVQPSELHYPIVVFRDSETEYRAILLRCTHQGTILDVSGNLISCSAHGSEFSSTGELLNGPAATNLRQFPIKITSDSITISLKIN